MALSTYLQAQNSGKQMWQMLYGNIYSIGKAFNATGLCRALVIQWHLEIHFSNGAGAEQHARYLLRGNFGRGGYAAVIQAQNNYVANLSHEEFVTTMSGGILQENNRTDYHNSQGQWYGLRQKIYGIGQDGVFRLNFTAAPYRGMIRIEGPHNRFLRWAMGDGWAHAIGVHCDGQTVYIFDPNYGVFVFPANQLGTIGSFFDDLWREYGANEGSLSDII